MTDRRQSKTAEPKERFAQQNVLLSIQEAMKWVFRIVVPNNKHNIAVWGSRKAFVVGVSS